MAGAGPRAHPSPDPTEFLPFRIAGGLAVYRLGRGEPVLLMPAPHRFERVGLAGFDTLIGGLVRLGRQVITYDPPGSGRSAGPARVSVEEVLECTDRALDACCLAQPVDAVGHSMAGLALLAYTLQRPHRISRLVLIGTGSGGPAYMRAPGAWRCRQRAMERAWRGDRFHDPAPARPPSVAGHAGGAADAAAR